MVARTASLNDEDIWHVQVADGDVRIVSLEQLDDLFRLDLIDDNVNVWQPGMPAWQPLKVVAGMDEDELKQVPPVSRPPPAPPKRTAPAADPFARTAWAPTPSFAPPASLGPVTQNLEDLAYRPRPPGGSLGKWVIGLVAVAGIAVTAYRNGLVHEAFQSFHQDPLYRKLEATIGGPSFGTPSSVDRMTASDRITLSAAQPAAAPAEPPRAATPALKAPELLPPSAPSPAAATPAAAAAPAPSAPLPAAAPPAPPAKAISLDELPHEKPKVAGAPAAAAPHPSAPAKPAGKGLSSGLKGSSNAYDPLNGKL